MRDLASVHNHVVMMSSKRSAHVVSLSTLLAFEP